MVKQNDIPKPGERSAEAELNLGGLDVRIQSRQECFRYVGVAAFFALVIFLLLPSCRQNLYLQLFEGKSPDATNYYPISSNEAVVVNGLRISIDARWEAYSVIRVLLGQYDMINWHDEETEVPDYQYLNNVNDYFREYEDSNVIEMAREMYTLNFPVDAPPEYIQYLDGNLALRDDVVMSSDWLEFFGDDRWTYFFIEILQDFVHLTNFNSFFEQNREFYASVLTSYTATIQEWTFQDEIEGYFGETRSSYDIVLEPLQRGGNYGVEVRTVGTEAAEAYLYFRIRGFDGQTPIFYDENARITLRHEFAHIFCNPLIDLHWSELARFDELNEHLDSALMAEQGYGDAPTWKTMVYEHVVRAIASRLTFLESEVLGSADLYEQTEVNGFIYVEGLCSSLEIYENNRETYPTISAYFPDLIEAFAEYL